MKTLKLQNKNIEQIFNLLNHVELSQGQANRGKSKLINRLLEKDKELGEEKKVILEDYYQKDESGDFKREDGKLVPKAEVEADKQEKEANEKFAELLDEEVEISFVEHSKKYEALFSELDSLEQKLSTQHALAYDVLMDAYEANEKEEEK